MTRGREGSLAQKRSPGAWFGAVSEAVHHWNPSIPDSFWRDSRVLLGVFLSKGPRILVRDCSEWELSPEVGRDRLLRKDRLERGLEPSRKPFTNGIHRFPIHFGVVLAFFLVCF